MKKQNISHAVMSQRHEEDNSLDDFPTPPWATRALLKYELKKHNIKKMSCLEPACHVGHMSRVLEENFKRVVSSDIKNYGYGLKKDYLTSDYKKNSFDWVITNPPFNLAEEFFFKSLKIARIGVALLVRTVFIESSGRYNRIFKKYPPSRLSQFVERVPMVKGRLDRKASTATGYAWIIWENETKIKSKLTWIPPCRTELQRDEDYLDLVEIKKGSKVKKKKQLNFKL